MAPDILKGWQKGYSMESDVWSLGVVLYKLLFNYNPFEADKVDQIKSRILNNDYLIPADTNISFQA